MSTPRRPKPAGCAVCGDKFEPFRATTIIEDFGVAHRECAEDIERSISEGGCHRERYFEAFTAAMRRAG